MRKSFLILAAVLLVCSCSEKKESRAKAPIRVKMQVVSPSMADNSVTYVGIVEEREGTAVSFTGMGVVKRLLVNEGQAVARGQLIAEMDDTQARNLLAGAEATMKQANDAHQRYGMLHENGSLPEVKWVEIESKVEQAKSQLEVAKKNLADCRLTAPVSGIIGKKLIDAGETAMPSQAVVTILDISSVKVKVSVPEAEISHISSTMKGGHIEKGVEADPLTHTYDVRIQVANGERKLLPGMVANVQFSPEGSTEVQMKSLPVTSVQRRSDGSLFVWVVAADSTAHRATVTTGDTHGNYITIIDGINVGQYVVTEGYQKLSEGTKVVKSER